MELNGCGRDKGCFRYCDTRPKCPAEEALYMIAIETEESNNNLEGNEVLMKIGGYLNENKTVNDTRKLRCCSNHFDLMTQNQQIYKTLMFSFTIL